MPESPTTNYGEEKVGASRCLGASGEGQPSPPQTTSKSGPKKKTCLHEWSEKLMSVFNKPFWFCEKCGVMKHG
jgi:hypothetical protein